MSEVSTGEEEFDAIVESFVQRYRQGQRPTIDEFAHRYPSVADKIRRLFPAIVTVEELGSVADIDQKNRSSDCFADRIVPTQLGDYRILREVGRGGMGVVYEAIQESLHRHVALKVYPRPMGQNNALEERFRREAQSAAKLHHTNIVPVFGVGEADERLFYAMQFIEGTTLDVVLEEVRRVRGKLVSSPIAGSTTLHLSQASQSLLNGDFELLINEGSKSSSLSSSLDSNQTLLNGSETSRGLTTYFRNIARLGVQVAGALDYAHRHGVIHRDIKPSNLMMDPAGTLWVMDFGLAKSEGASDLTQSGDLLGTLRYMAHEQLAGTADERSDIYSLGATLYEMATLRPAFDEVIKIRLIDRIRSEQPSRPSVHEPRIPSDLETILLKAMARDAQDRYSSAQSLADDLSAYLQDRPIAARRISVWEQTVRWCRRNPVVAGLSSLVVVLVLAAAIASTWAAAIFKQQRDEALSAKQSAVQQLWKSKLHEARSILSTREPGQRLDALKRVREVLKISGVETISAEDLLELRSVAASAFLLPDLAIEREWQSKSAATQSYIRADFDEQLKRYAVQLENESVEVRRLSDNSVILNSPCTGDTQVWLSPSGNLLAMVSTTPTNERAVKVLDIQEEPARVLYEVTGPYCEAFEFSSDDRWGIHTHAERGLVSVELSSGRVQTKKGRFDRWWPMIRLDPTNRQIAYPVNIWTKPAIAIQDLAENKIVTTIPTTDFIESIGWHPSGDLLAVGLADLSIGLFDVHERRLLRTIVGHTKHGMMTDFNHRGDWIISNDWSNRLRIWDAVTGRELLSTPSWHHRHRISQDDSIIATESASASGSLRLLRTTRCDAIRTLGDHAGRTVGGTRTPIVMGKGSVAWTELSVSSSTPGVMNSHLAAVSLTTGEVLFQLDQPATWPVAFLEDGSILSAGKTGLHRWTSRFDQQSGKIQLGSPTLIHPEPVEYHVSSSSSGDVIAIARGPSVRVIRKGRDDLVFNQNFRVMWNVGVSPDGQLLAISNCYPTLERKDNIHIIETATGKIIASLPANSRSMIEFSSDGRYFHSRLDSTISRCQIWHVGDWKDPQVIDASAITFAHQGPLAAISNANGTIRLVDFEAGKDIVQFSLQGEESVFVRDFSRDGAYLVVSSDRHNVTRRIDLRAIREQLATLGLDWND